MSMFFQHKAPWDKATIKLLAILLVAFILLTILGQIAFPAVLRMEICSERAGISSLYYQGPDGKYWPAHSSMQAGCQILAFDLLDYHNPILKLHLPAAANFYVIRGVWIQVGWFRVDVDLDSFYARKDVENISRTSDGIRITMSNDVSDPQVAFALSRPRRIAALHWGSSFVNASLFSLAAFLASVLSRRNWDVNIQRDIHRLAIFLKQESFQAKEFAALAGMSIALNIYSIANFSISIDDEMAAFRVQPDIWLEEGRWTTYLLERFVFPQPVIPYVHNLMFALSIALAYMFLVRAHNLPRDWRMFLAFPVFGAFPTWWFITAFYANLPSVSLGVMLITLAGFIFARTRSMGRGIPWGWLGLQVVLLTVAVGGYQSFLLMYLAVGVGLVLFEFISDDSHPDQMRRVWLSLAQLGIVSVLGFAAYWAINSIAQNLIVVRASGYIEGFWNFKILLAEPLFVLMVSFLTEMRAYYSGAVSKYGIALFSIGFVVFFAWLSVLVNSWGKDWRKTFLSLILWSGLLVLPFTLNIVSAKDLPTRSFFAIPYIIWLMCTLLLQSNRVLVKLFNGLLVSALILQILVAQGTYAATAYFTQHQDRMLAYDLFRRMSEIDDGFTYSQTIFVDIYGTKRAELIYPNPYGGTMGASFFEFAWKADDISRMINFMKLMGYSNIQAVEREQRLLLTPLFEDMPAWPVPGCVQKIDGIYLIKLSDLPDPLHVQYEK